MIFPELLPRPDRPDADPSVFYGRMSNLDHDARIPDQFARANRYTEAAGTLYIAHAFADDGIGAWREDVYRPDFERMLKLLRTGQYRTVIVWEETRITRDPVVGAEFGRIMKRIKGKLISTDGEKATVYDFTRQRDRDAWHNAVGKSVSDSGMKSELVKRTFEVKHENREFRGGPVGFGWNVELTRKNRKVVGVWTVNEDEAAYLREAAKRIRNGEAILKVANDFFDRGVRIRHRQTKPEYARETGTLTATTLKQYLMNPRIAGLYATGTYKTGWTVVGPYSNFPGILTEDEWRETVAALGTAPKRRGTGTRVKNVFAGYYVCFECKRSLVNTATRGAALWRHRLGKAQSHMECSQSFSIPAAQADDHLKKLVDRYLVSRAWEKPEDIRDSSELHAERTKREKELDELPDKIENETVSYELAGRMEKRLKKRLREIDEELAKNARFTIVIDGDLAVKQWRSGTLMEKRRILSTIMRRIIVIPGRDLPLVDRLDTDWIQPHGG